MKYFYSHIIEIESIVVELDQMDLSDEQKSHLATLVDSTIHHTVLDVIFTNLPEEHKTILVEKIKIDPKDREIMEFLKNNTENIEEQIKEVVEELKKELKADLAAAKKIKGEK